MNTIPNLTAGGDVASGVDALAFRNGMARLGAAVTIITTDGPAGRAGFAASAVCSVTDTPPTLLVCVNRSSSVFPVISENQAVCVNVLSPAQQPLSALFGGKTPVEERFAAANWHRGVSGAPMLEGALVAFDCIVSKSLDVGTHRVLFCSVLEIEEGEEGGALVYFRRGYHEVGTPSAG